MLHGVYTEDEGDMRRTQREAQVDEDAPPLRETPAEWDQQLFYLSSLDPGITCGT